MEVMAMWNSRQMILHRLLLIFVLYFSSALALKAQSNSDNSSSLIPNPGKEALAPGSPEAEMLHRAAIRREVEAHREMIARAKENTRLGTELAAAVGKDTQPLAEDLKKLDRMEKLARKIRGGSGGSEDEDVLQNPPKDLATGIKMLAETSEKLLKEVEKTSRLVASAAVIRRSNEVIQLVRHVKSFVGR